jgi:trehalose 6-phosphate phosphatase
MRNGGPAPSHEWCLFLDIDGTLLEIADTPSSVLVDSSLNALLAAVSQRLEGALALVSGRSIATIDQLFAPLIFPAAGQHGAERRSATGACFAAPTSRSAEFDGARAQLRAFAKDYPGVVFEDKGRSIALHFRLAPERESDARRVIVDAARPLADLEVQEGNMVFEIKPKGLTKGTAVEAFMREPPFAGRTPVFVGDDLTDEPGLRFVESAGGVSIAVGDRLRGQWSLKNPREVRAWLAAIAEDHRPQSRA